MAVTMQHSTLNNIHTHTKTQTSRPVVLHAATGAGVASGPTAIGRGASGGPTCCAGVAGRGASSSLTSLAIENTIFVRPNFDIFCWAFMGT